MVRFSVEEVDFLEEAYQKSSKSPCQIAKILAEALGCEEYRVASWFRRRKRRDENLSPLLDKDRKQLEIAYQKNNTPDQHDLEKLAKMLDIKDMEEIISWFRRRRKTDYGHKKRLFNKEQTKYLMSIYAKNKYPKGQQLQRMAEKFGKTTQQMFYWFVKKRTNKKDSSIQTEVSDITDLTTIEVKLLEDAFAENPQPTSKQLKEIQEKTNINEDRLKFWFDRKRRQVKSLVFVEKLKFEKHYENVLREAYQNNKYLTTAELDELADRLGRDRKGVQQWFRYRRIHDKEFDKDRVITPKYFKMGADKQNVLNEEYQKNKNLPAKEMYALADRVGLRQPQVYTWFLSKRSTDKDYKSKIAPFTEEQRQSLEALYQTNPNPSRDEKKKLAIDIGLSYRQVTNWLSFNRSKSGYTKAITRLTTKQKEVLFDVYKEIQYPRGARIAELANRIGATAPRIRRWFQIHRRNSRVANFLQAKQEESDPQDIKALVKMEPMDVELGDRK